MPGNLPNSIDVNKANALYLQLLKMKPDAPGRDKLITEYNHLTAGIMANGAIQAGYDPTVATQNAQDYLNQFGPFKMSRPAPTTPEQKNSVSQPTSTRLITTFLTTTNPPDIITQSQEAYKAVKAAAPHGQMPNISVEERMAFARARALHIPDTTAPVHVPDGTNVAPHTNAPAMNQTPSISPKKP